MHDPRIGRFFAVDPLTAKYPWYTPYQFSGNKVISCIELEGLEEKEIDEITEIDFGKMDWGIEIDGVIMTNTTGMDKVLGWAIGRLQVIYWTAYKEGDKKTRIDMMDHIGINAQGQGSLLSNISINAMDIVPDEYKIPVINAMSNIVRAEHYMRDAKLTAAADAMSNFILDWKRSEDGLSHLEEHYDQWISAWQNNHLKGLVKFMSDYYGMMADIVAFSNGGYGVRMKSSGSINSGSYSKNFSLPKEVIRGHTTPWASMSDAQRKAFQHSYNRHAEELGLQAWKQGEAEALRKSFNEAVSNIRKAGADSFFYSNEWVNGVKTTVLRTEPVINGQKYYYYETLQGQFVSAGKM